MSATNPSSTSPVAENALVLYSTTVSDVGFVRSNNQDSSFAGRHLAAICDGMGGHAGGDTASTIAIRSLAHIEQDDTGNDIEKLAAMMGSSIMAAHDAIVGKAKHEHALAGMGTTVTAIALLQNHWVLAHIGDSRAYLLRNHHLIRATKDHSYVQHLIDTSRITETEAKNHPQRNVVMRVLGDFDIDPRPDISIRKALPGDRWLLCSDGVCGVLEDSTIAEILDTVLDPEDCAQQLVATALKAGSTDNATAVIADATITLKAPDTALNSPVPLVGGAVSASLENLADIINGPIATAPNLDIEASPAQRAAALTQDQSPAESAASAPRVAQPSEQDENGDTSMPTTGEIPVVQKKDGSTSADPHDPEVAKAIRTRERETAHRVRKHHSRMRATIITTVVVAIMALCGIGFAAYHWSQQQYYVGKAGDAVAIYQGVPTNLFGLSLSHEVERTEVVVSKLPDTWQEQLNRGIIVDSYDDAQDHVDVIRQQTDALNKEQHDQSPQSSPSASSSPSDASSHQASKPSGAGDQQTEPKS